MDRHYETVCIVKPDIGDDKIKAIEDKAVAIAGDKGSDVVVEQWGRRRLAYDIQKIKEGHYFIVTYTSPPDTVKELERILRINEDVLRYQTVALKERVAAEPEATETPAAAAPEATEAKATEAEATDAKATEAKATEPEATDAGAAAEPVKEEPKEEPKPLEGESKPPEVESKPLEEESKEESKPLKEEPKGGSDE